MEDELIAVAIWPDYDWCLIDEVDEMTHKSDDFITVELDFYGNDEPTHKQIVNALMAH